MRQDDLYDVFVNIDEKYIDEAVTALQNNKSIQRKNKSGTIRNLINTRQLTGLAVSILSVVLAFSIVLSIAELTKKRHKENNSNTVVILNASIVTSSNLENISKYSGNEMPPEYFSFIVIPSIVQNGSSFTMDCSFGLANDCWMFTYDKYYPELVERGIDAGDEYDFSLYIENKVYINDPTFSTESDKITFFDESGTYKKTIDFEQLKVDFTFDPGRIVFQEGRATFSNINNADSLPFHLPVPVKVNTIEKGTKGRILAGFQAEAKNGHASDGNGSSVFYYCSGDYIGFGETEEEAFKNSFNIVSEDDAVESRDNCQEFVEQIKPNISYCDNYMHLSPVKLSEKYIFDKNQERDTI